MMDDVQELDLLEDLEPTCTEAIPPLRDGDRLTREEFHRRYEAMPHVKKAELIEGVVHMPSPVHHGNHGSPNFDMGFWLGYYRAMTPGIEGGLNSTLRLDPVNELQPDALLLILPSHGGRVRISADGWLDSATDWIGEVAASSASHDLGAKLEVYRLHSAREYFVWRTLEYAIDWFVLKGGRFQRISLGSDGIYRSKVLPGLWLDPVALVNRDMARVLQVLQQGIASSEHVAFVKKLVRAAGQKHP